jgi:hypothetical protein
LSDKSNEFMHLDVTPYIGQWVGIYNNRVVSHSTSFIVTYTETKKFSGYKKPSVALVSSENSIIL